MHRSDIDSFLLCAVAVAAGIGVGQVNPLLGLAFGSFMGMLLFMAARRMGERVSEPPEVPEGLALLEECLHNGETGKERLWAWFSAERGIIERTVVDQRTRFEDALRSQAYRGDGH